MKARKFFSGFLGLLVLLFLILFALSNREDVQIGLFPFGLTVVVPLSVAILGAMGLGALIGGAMVWISGFRHRRAAKRAEAASRALAMKGGPSTAVTTGR